MVKNRLIFVKNLANNLAVALRFFAQFFNAPHSCKGLTLTFSRPGFVDRV